MLSRQREFCSVAVNGEALASGLAVLVGEAGARSLASKTHRKNFRIETLFLSMFRGLFDIYLLGIPAPPSGYRSSAFICVTITMFWRLKEK